MQSEEFDSGWNPDEVSAAVVWLRNRAWNSTANQFSGDITRLYRHPTVRNSYDFSRALTMLVAERDYLHDKLGSLQPVVKQRDAAVEAVKILLGVISGDPEFSSVESTVHCTDAARQLMKLHNLWEIETEHVQDEIR
jgi:hypothetical protein